MKHKCFLLIFLLLVLEKTMAQDCSTLVTVNVGPDITACFKPILLTASGIGFEEGKWFVSGNGKFEGGDNLPNVTYVPSWEDYDRGHVIINFNPTTAPNCPPQSDTLVVTFSKISVDFTPAIKTVCEGDSVDLLPIVKGNGPLTYFWPSINSNKEKEKVAVYKDRGYRVVVTNEFGCQASDSIYFFVDSRPTLYAGTDLTVKSDYVLLEAKFTNATGVKWSSFNTGNFVNDNSISPHYYFSEQDKEKGFGYIFVRTTGGSNACPAAADTIKINYIPSYNISGYIYAGEEKSVSSLLSLYKLVDQKYELQDTMVFQSTLGSEDLSYSFKYRDNGKYLLLADPLPYGSLYGKYIPTYYTNALDWKSATVIEINNAHKPEIDIHLVPFTSTDPSWNTGNETISGSVVEIMQTNASLRASAENGMPMVIIYLTDKNGGKLAYTISDNQGQFAFNNVKAGEYKLLVEYAGINFQQAVTTMVDGDPSTPQEVTLNVTKEFLTGIQNNKFTKALLSVYPIPASTELNITLPESMNASSIAVSITNSLGQEVVKEQLPLQVNYTKVNIQMLPKGIYGIRLESEEGSYLGKFSKE